MKSRVIISMALMCALSACAFFEEPLTDLAATPGTGTAATPETQQIRGIAPPPPPPPNAGITPPAPPPLPTTTIAPPIPTVTGTDDSTFFVVSSIFDVPETATNLAFVHFTERNSRRETAICRALLDMHTLTNPADVPATAGTLIVWPIMEGQSAASCRAMVRAHEPLDVSSATAEQTNSNGPYILTRNTPARKQLIYDLSAIANRQIADSLTQWQQTLESDVQNWPDVIKAQ